MEALRVYCRAGRPEETARAISLVESGERDARFRPKLDEMKAARRMRVDEY
jgi:hypothetical protein